MKVVYRGIVFVATVCVLILTAANFGGQVARADTIQSWNLDICNSALQAVNACAGVAPAKVDATLNSANTQITLTVTAAAGFKLWDGGIFGFNWSGPAITAGLDTSAGPKAPYTLNADNGSVLDGFGSFTNAWDMVVAGVGGSSNGATSLTFMLTGTGLSLSDFTANNKGELFAAHVADFQSPGSVSTGWVANDPNPPAVPEPFTSLLVGGGLIGIAAARFRRTT